MKKAQQDKVIGTALATVSKVTTTIDGALRITLDIPGGDDKEIAAKLLDLALNPQSVFVSFVKPDKY